MENNIAYLPEELISFLFMYLSVPDIVRLCNSSSQINQIGKNDTLWYKIIERNYSNYLPSLYYLKSKRKMRTYKELIKYLHDKRIIPIYVKRGSKYVSNNDYILIGYITYGPDNTFDQLYKLLAYTDICKFTGDELKTLEIGDINNGIYKSEGIFTTPDFYLPLSAENDIFSGIGSSRYYETTTGELPYPPRGFTIKLVNYYYPRSPFNSIPTSKISLQEIVNTTISRLTHKAYYHIPYVNGRYNLFNTLERINVYRD